MRNSTSFTKIGLRINFNSFWAFSNLLGRPNYKWGRTLTLLNRSTWLTVWLCVYELLSKDILLCILGILVLPKNAYQDAVFQRALSKITLLLLNVYELLNQFKKTNLHKISFNWGAQSLCGKRRPKFIYFRPCFCIGMCIAFATSSIGVQILNRFLLTNSGFLCLLLLPIKKKP